jgi:phenylalanyl-tRNA synthetase beta chain
MRRSITPNLVKTLAKNPNNKEKTFSVFEAGNIYSNFIENMQSFCVAGLRAGDVFKNSIHNKNRCWSFFDVREDFLSLLQEFGMSGHIVDYSIDSEVPKYYHPSKSIRIKLGNIVLGICGELHPNIIKKFDINHSSVAIFELFTHNIPIKGYKIKQYKPLIISNYQKIKRDLAFILDSQVRVGDIIKTINSLKEKLIDNVEVFDLYNGITEGKKSVAFSFEIQPTEANITDEIINGVMNKVIKAIQDKHNGILRDK